MGYEDFFVPVTKDILSGLNGSHLDKSLFNIGEGFSGINFYLFGPPIKITYSSDGSFWVNPNGKKKAMSICPVRDINRNFLKEPRFLSAKGCGTFGVKFLEVDNIFGINLKEDGSYILNKYDKKSRALSRAIVGEILNTNTLRGFPEQRTIKLVRSLYQLL